MKIRSISVAFISKIKLKFSHTHTIKIQTKYPCDHKMQKSANVLGAEDHALKQTSIFLRT